MGDGRQKDTGTLRYDATDYMRVQFNFLLLLTRPSLQQQVILYLVYLMSIYSIG